MFANKFKIQDIQTKYTELVAVLNQFNAIQLPTVSDYADFINQFETLKQIKKGEIIEVCRENEWIEILNNLIESLKITVTSIDNFNAIIPSKSNIILFSSIAKSINTFIDLIKKCIEHYGIFTSAEYFEIYRIITGLLSQYQSNIDATLSVAKQVSVNLQSEDNSILENDNTIATNFINDCDKQFEQLNVLLVNAKQKDEKLQARIKKQQDEESLIYQQETEITSNSNPTKELADPQTTTSSTIDHTISLPKDLLITVFNYFDISNLISFSKVNKRWLTVFKEIELVKLKEYKKKLEGNDSLLPAFKEIVLEFMDNFDSSKCGFTSLSEFVTNFQEVETLFPKIFSFINLNKNHPKKTLLFLFDIFIGNEYHEIIEDILPNQQIILTRIFLALVGELALNKMIKFSSIINEYDLTYSNYSLTGDDGNFTFNLPSLPSSTFIVSNVALRYLISTYYNGTLKDAYGSYLSYVLIRKNFIIAKDLLQMGHSVDIKDMDPNVAYITPLFAAIKSQNGNLVSLILSKGANPNLEKWIVTRFGMWIVNPLVFALWNWDGTISGMIPLLVLQGATLPQGIRVNEHLKMQLGIAFFYRWSLHMPKDCKKVILNFLNKCPLNLDQLKASYKKCSDYISALDPIKKSGGMTNLLQIYNIVYTEINSTLGNNIRSLIQTHIFSKAEFRFQNQLLESIKDIISDKNLQIYKENKIECDKLCQLKAPIVENFLKTLLGITKINYKVIETLLSTIDKCLEKTQKIRQENLFPTSEVSYFKLKPIKINKFISQGHRVFEDKLIDLLHAINNYLTVLPNSQPLKDYCASLLLMHCETMDRVISKTEHSL